MCAESPVVYLGHGSAPPPTPKRWAITLCNQLVCGYVLTKFIQTVVPPSISDSASIFRKDGWWEAFVSGYILKQLCWFQLIPPGVYARTVKNIPHPELLRGTQVLLGFIRTYSQYSQACPRNEGAGSVLYPLALV